MNRLIVTVRGQPIVKKNSKMIASRGAFKSIISSNAYQAWEKSALIQLNFAKRWDGGYPVFAHYKFFVTTRRLFDLSNMCEGINDAMQQAQIIDQDDYEHLVPVFHGAFCGVDVDKINPRLVVMLADQPLTK